MISDLCHAVYGGLHDPVRASMPARYKITAEWLPEAIPGITYSRF